MVRSRPLKHAGRRAAWVLFVTGRDDGVRGRVVRPDLALRHATNLPLVLAPRTLRAAVTSSVHPESGPQATLRRFAGANNMPPTLRVPLAERA